MDKKKLLVSGVAVAATVMTGVAHADDVTQADEAVKAPVQKTETPAVPTAEEVATVANQSVTAQEAVVADAKTAVATTQRQ